MRVEVENWWRQALKDLETAKKNLKIKEYYAAAFFSHQSVEKALKALYIHKKRETPGPTHSLIFLGKSVNIPKRFLSILRKLNPDYVLTRYPDAAYGLPYELYDENMAIEKIQMAEAVIEWVKKKLKKK
ncbi:MAG: HEPN domain-containing protein [Candidatus Aenigmarchaeota archaeon]|nr:HEPN domain-containing protein [Candidatus Aenigmarchaeota archaeon]